MASRIHEQRPSSDRTEKNVDEFPTQKVGEAAIEGAQQADTEKVVSDIDILLDEIERAGLVGENAQEFVDEFVQLGGE